MQEISEALSQLENIPLDLKQYNFMEEITSIPVSGNKYNAFAD